MGKERRKVELKHNIYMNPSRSCGWNVAEEEFL
jgi:hypothetical protein